VRHGLIALLALAACDDHPSPGFDCLMEACEDCRVIAEKLADHPGANFTQADCEACDGMGCSDMPVPAFCTNLPCQLGRRIVRGCNVDKDCEVVFAPFCGHHTARHHVCVMSDDH